MPIKYDSELEKAVLAYLSECDNPVPDYNYRRTLRNRLRELTGARASASTLPNVARTTFCGETDCTFQDGWCKCGMEG